MFVIFIYQYTNGQDFLEILYPLHNLYLKYAATIIVLMMDRYRKKTNL